MLARTIQTRQIESSQTGTTRYLQGVRTMDFCAHRWNGGRPHTRQTTPFLFAPNKAFIANLVNLIGWLTFISIVLYPCSSWSSQKLLHGGSKIPATGATTSGTSPNSFTDAVMRLRRSEKDVTSHFWNLISLGDEETRLSASGVSLRSPMRTRAPREWASLASARPIPGLC